MFIKEYKKKHNNFNKSKLLYNLNCVNYKSLVTTKNFNKKTSWYRKKKIKNSLFHKVTKLQTHSYYLVISKFSIDHGRKYFDVRINLRGMLHTIQSTWGVYYRRKIRSLLPKYYLWFNYENMMGQWINSLKNHESFIFHNLIIYTSIIAKSPGTYCRLVSKKKNGLYTFLLPSLTKLRTYQFKEAIVGRNEGIYFNKQKFFKAGNLHLSKNHVKVRGIAKNPVDHPNGGRSNTKGSFKTPWGKIAKNNK